jgi:hypothetical protein
VDVEGQAVVLVAAAGEGDPAVLAGEGRPGRVVGAGDGDEDAGEQDQQGEPLGQGSTSRVTVVAP